MGNFWYLIHLAAAIWVIYDAWAVNKSLSAGSKIIWTIFALLFSVLTAIIYYFTQKR